MQAIFTGTLASGFKIMAVAADGAAEGIVIARLANGDLTEAIDVQSPESLDQRARADQEGEHFVVFGKGLQSGFAVYGPFGDEDVAEQFAERCRPEDDEWQTFWCAQPVPVAVPA